ncbi:serine hydrolase [Aquincola sp. S2]|uniref:Serine hydrolase n=1 Tax=Pseudaquabacterium terrae TaxID=2732868 RepID=A0ABX2EEW4_9BURK|nr:serine hydrolase [Aquabacterium terrae]NRF67159.1 serine hydrolase [Aquabacterium terrae]
MRPTLFALAATASIAGCSLTPLDQPLTVASGLTSHLMCSGHLITGRPADVVYRQSVEVHGAMPLLRPFVQVDVDAERQQVRTQIGGGYRTRAIHRPGEGCLLLHDNDAPPRPDPPLAWGDTPPLLPEIAGPAPVPASDPRLAAALDQAFAEPPGDAYRHTQAVVIVHRGRVIAERYAPGIGVRTPMLSFSVAKTLTNALVGTLVQRGQLALDRGALLPQWSDPDDPRRAITIDHLLRQTAGLAVPEQNNSGFDLDSRIKYVERDPVAAIAALPPGEAPGTRWAYSDANFLTIGRVLRDTLGGSAAGVRRHAQQALFAPLGMRDVQIDADATGTPLISHSTYAPARDWARLGLLFLNDGVVGGERLLPPGWVRDSTTPTPGTGYGAGLWTNALPGTMGQWGIPWGLPSLPKDTYFARGYTGQFIVIVPSQQLVVVRMGPAKIRRAVIDDIDRLVAQVIEALPAPVAALSTP